MVYTGNRPNCRVIENSGGFLPGVGFLGHRIISWLEIWFCHRGAVSLLTPNKSHTLFADQSPGWLSYQHLSLQKLILYLTWANFAASIPKPKLSLSILRGWLRALNTWVVLVWMPTAAVRPKNRLLRSPGWRSLRCTPKPLYITRLWGQIKFIFWYTKN